MKKATVIVLLIPLVLFEIYLCTAFLPLNSQHAIEKKTPRILPETHDWTPITHPNLDQEIEQVLREHFWLKVALYAITVILLAANTWVIYRLRRFGTS